MAVVAASPRRERNGRQGWRRARSATGRRSSRALQRIVARFDGSRPVAAVMQDVVDDVAATFEITLVSVYLPDRARPPVDGRRRRATTARSTSSRSGSASSAGRPRRTRPSSCPTSSPTPTTGRPRRTSGARWPSPVAPRRRAARGRQLRGHATSARSDPPTSPSPRWSARSIAAALRSARLDEERRLRLHAIERVLDGQSRRSPPTWTGPGHGVDRRRRARAARGRGVALISRRPTARTGRRRSRASRRRSSTGRAGHGLVGRAIGRPGRGHRTRRASWPPAERVVRPGGDDAARRPWPADRGLRRRGQRRAHRHA